MPDKMKFVWSSPWFIGLPLYYINRYMPLVDEILLLYCACGQILGPSLTRIGLTSPIRCKGKADIVEGEYG